MSKNVVVVGGGFAGLWAAVGAARKRNELGLAREQMRITLVDRNHYHTIRVRNYELNEKECIVNFDQILDPIGVDLIRAEITEINVADQAVYIYDETGLRPIAYDRLVFALGSELRRPSDPGFDEFTFDIDTHAAAERLRKHLFARTHTGKLRTEQGVLVAGAGLTGIELATEIATYPKAPELPAGHARVILLDASNDIGSHLGREVKPVVAQALKELGVETRTGAKIASVDAEGVTLADGERILAGTVVWCAGMQANPLTRDFGVERDAHGRLPVDEFLRIKGVRNIFAAGDSARAKVDDSHVSIMSCQHARPDAAAAHRLVCHRRRPGRLGSSVYRGLGPQGCSCRRCCEDN
jgi:NADH dehydrogenase